MVGNILENNGLCGLMAGKRGLVMGVANKNSIAWGVAKQLHEAGAEIALTYQGALLERRIKPLADSIDVTELMICDVADDDSIKAVMEHLEEKWGKIDFIVHAIAFADKDELAGGYIETSRDNFKISMDISVYSFTAVLQKAEKIMSDDFSAITLSYYGSEKTIPHYNVMGVAKAALEASVRYLAQDLGKKGGRVNAISAGPIKTLASAGISGMRAMLKWNQINAPLKRNVTQDEVGKSALYLLSDLGSGVSGEVHHVDAGYHSIGMLSLDNIEETADFANDMASKKAALKAKMEKAKKEAAE